MASTYSPLKFELIGSGEQAGTWGNTTNTNLGTAVEEAIVGSADVSFSSTDVTVTLTDVNTTQTARHLRLNLTGTSGGARQLILGSGCQIEKPYLINNGLADAVTVKNTTGTGIAVPAGKTMWVYNNGVNVVDAVTHLSSLTLGAALPTTSGGTGATTATGTGSNVLATSPTIVSPELTTAPYVNGSYRSNIVAMGALDVDCSAGNYFTKTINGASTFTFSNAPSSRSFSFTLELTHTSGAVTWPAAVQWPGGTAPSLTTGKTHLFFFVTDDAGTRWRGSSLVNYTT